MELAQLQLVRQVLEAGSISKAALHLNKAHSLVSRQISALEKECGDRIFYRNGRGVILTEFGESILPQIDLVLSTVGKIAQKAQSDGIGGKVKVGAIPSIARKLTTPLFTSLREAHPNLILSIQETYSASLEEQLTNGQLDIAIFLRYNHVFTKEDHILGEWDNYLIGAPSHPILQNDTVRFDDLAGIPLLRFPSSASSNSRKLYDSQGVLVETKFKVVAEVGDSDLMIKLATAGIGFMWTCIDPDGFSPLTRIGQHIADGTLKASRIVEPELRRVLVLSTTPTPLPRTQAVVKQIIETLNVGAAQKLASIT